MTQLSYAAAGVSIDNGDELVDRIKPAAKRTMIPGVLGSALSLKSAKTIKTRCSFPALTA